MIEMFPLKERWLLNNGFVKMVAPKNTTIYRYKRYDWTKEKIENTPMGLIIKYKMLYDGKITEAEFNKCKTKFDKPEIS